jgi:vacuolar-type H+-ATPase subunit H
MGLMDDAKDTADATGKKVGEWVDDAKERVSDKVDEVKADADLKKAEAHKDAVDNKNDYKESLRNS